MFRRKSVKRFFQRNLGTLIDVSLQWYSSDVTGTAEVGHTSEKIQFILPQDSSDGKRDLRTGHDTFCAQNIWQEKQVFFSTFTTRTTTTS